MNTPAPHCTLEFSEMTARLERLRRLAENSLTSHELRAGVLRLTYCAEAAAEVKAVVELERACCGFLDFDVKEGASSITLTITAPAPFGETTAWLFAQFLPATLTCEAGPCQACCPSCT